ncbi:MAG TPA: hypothetical protein DD435_00275 [Cyanobacteria bacterium UBA8530]|nr:hypothetical protein [Cyanobacteria bacterium UBA8530]
MSFTMKKKILFVSLMMAFSVGSAFLTADAAVPAKAKAEHQACKGDHKACPKKAVYACPMHPEEKSDKTGKCSKCGMNLETKPEKKIACPKPNKTCK